ncbi:unnamed protein product [Brassica oleracea var. botrytis]
MVNSDHCKDQSFTISHIFVSNQPLPLPNFGNQLGHNNMRGAGPVSQISSASVHIVLPDTSTVLTMLFLQTAEASLEWSSTKASHEIGLSAMSDMLLPNYLQRMPHLRKVAPLQRSNVVAKSAVLYSIQIESGLTTTLLSLF